MDNCVFCKNNRFPYQGKIRRNNTDTILYEDDNIFITADIAPICEGHVLIVTKEHLCNFMHGDKNVRKAVVNAINFLRAYVYKTNDIVAFEHGSLGFGEAGNSVDHAHIHVVPHRLNVFEKIISDHKYIDSYAIEEEKYIEHLENRAYIATYEDQKVRFFLVNDIESQYLRYVLAEKLNQNMDINWHLAIENNQFIDKYDDTVLLFNKTISTIQEKDATYERLSKITGFSLEKEIITYVANQIIKTPFIKADKEMFQSLFSQDYEPGLFYISEREDCPGFLLEECNIGYLQWFISKILSEIEQISLSDEYHEQIHCYGIRNMVSDVYWIFNEMDADGKRLVDYLMNQVYSDFFRRTIMYLLTGSAFSICHNHKKNNDLMEKVGIFILKNTGGYSLYQRLKQSLFSGVVGMNLKESLISTAPISLAGTFKVSFEEKSFDSLLNSLDEKINRTTWNGINDYNIFETKVLAGKEIKISWITDDYLATMFEMKFIDEIMDANPNLSVTIIPRFDSYSNDASFTDVLHFMSLPIFESLNDKYKSGRLYVCRNGCDISTFDGTRMSKETAKELISSDYVIISGARAFEMGQGIKKDVFYTGIAVCKGYTESVTGYDRDSGAIIFLFQPNGTRSFYGFRERNKRIVNKENYQVGFASCTAKDYSLNRNR